VNAARLIFGWLFLAGFTAAGTYYAMDEVDQRVGLSRFQLHEKLGLVRSVPIRQVSNNQTPPINNQVNPINNQTPPINNQTPPINNQTPAPVNNQTPPINNQTPIYQAPPINNQTPPINNQNPPINNQTPPIYNQRPPINNQTPPINNQRSPYNNQTPPINNNQLPPPQPPQRPSSPDVTQANIRLVGIQSEAKRLHGTVSSMHAQYGTGRLDGYLHSLDSFVAEADGALRSGDVANARRYMDEAQKQIDKLKELLDQ
jgi:hypothetical protein